MKTILLLSPYWREEHRWMVSSYKLAELWQRLGYKVIVVCMASKAGVEHVSDTLIIHRRKDIFLPDPLNFGISFGFTGYVRRLIKKEKPDIIIANKILFWTSFAIIPLRLTGYRVLLLTDAFVGMTWWPRGLFSKIIMGIGAWTVGWLVMLCADRIVTFHPQPPSLLKKLGIAKKTTVIPTGIDVSKFEVRSQKSEVRSQKSDTVTVSYVGRLESVKGVDDFLAAAAPLVKEYPQLKVQVVGWYPSTSSGRPNHHLVERYGREVHFTGLRNDVPEILASTDIFVLPSYSEGLSNALMEAMSSECACIATEVGGNRFLIPGGTVGFLYPPGDREALQAHIRRLLEDPAKRTALGVAARKQIAEHFSWERVGKQYKELFQELGL